MGYLLSAMLLAVGLVHLLPLSGVLGSERLTALYGLAITEPNLLILMRHRAVLFGLLGVFLVFAAFRPALQVIALTAGFISVVSFLWLAWAIGAYNPQIGRVVTGDVGALVCLVIGLAAYIHLQAKG